MHYNFIIMNPPYLGNLHLNIMNIASTQLYSSGELINLHPARWIQDPLYTLKNKSDHGEFLGGIASQITHLEILCGRNSNRDFTNTNSTITNSTDLCITKIENCQGIHFSIYTPLAEGIFNKILPYALDYNVKEHIDEKCLDGIRCEVKEMLPIANINFRMDRTVRKKCVEFVINSSREAVFENGYDKEGNFWSTTRGAGIKKIKEGDPFALSIKFPNREEAENFRNSCLTQFYRNWIYLIKFDMHVPLFALPWMPSYKEEWTNEKFCKFFHLSPEEEEFMCRERYDYRIKDFWNSQIVNENINI